MCHSCKRRPCVNVCLRAAGGTRSGCGHRHMCELGRCLRETGQALDRVGVRAQGSEKFKELFSRHRQVMGVYEKQPEIANDAWVAPNASVIGEVSIASQSSIWYGCVLRADVNEIYVGGGSNIQDGTVVTVAKTNPLGFPASTYIGNEVSIGSGCSLHSCTIEDQTEIGAGSIICDGAVVEKHAQVGAGSVVPAGTRIPSGQHWQGNPAKYVRDVSDDEVMDMTNRAATFYETAEKHAYEFLPYGTLYKDAEKMLEKQ